MLRQSSIRTLRDTIISLLVALCTGAAGATTTTIVATTTTTTTLPPTSPSELCTCNASNVCEVTKGTYPVNPGSNLNFGTCALVIDPGATVQLATSGPVVFIEAQSLTMNAQAVIQGAPTTQAPNDGGSVAVNVSGNIQLAAGATINVDAQNAGASEIDLTAGGTVTLDRGAGTPALSASATANNGSGGTLNLRASGNVSIGAALSATSGPLGAGGQILITTNNAKVTVNAPLDASGALDGAVIDLESDLALVTTSGAKLAVDGGSLPGSGGQIILNSNVQGSVTIGGPISGTAAGSGQGGELDSFTNAGSITVNAAVDLSGGAGGGGGGTVDLEPAGDLIVNAALNLAGHGVGSCGGSATLGSAGSGNVMLSSNPIDVSGDSCGMGKVVVTAADTATAPGEINADSNATTTGGGLIQLTAGTLTVDGTLHANGGGGEVNLQACSLTLSATGQGGATGPNGFTLLQASGPMEIEGTLTATRANTLDYLDPAEPPFVHSSSIVPPAVIVLNNPPVRSLCFGNTPTTTSPTTSTLAVITTTTTTMASTTSTPSPPSTSPPIGMCSPPSCNDRGVCMPGACVDGQCKYMALAGVDCATAALDAIKSLVDASAAAFGNKAIRRKVLGKVAHLGHLVDNASGQRGRTAKAKRKAANAFTSFGTFVSGAAGRHKLDSTLAESLKVLTRDASSALER